MFSNFTENFTYPVFLSDLDGNYHPVLSEMLNSVAKSITIMDNGTLSISSIKKEDEGVYQCAVSNEVGSPLHKTANLRVIGEKM